MTGIEKQILLRGISKPFYAKKSINSVKVPGGSN